jgi:hypothetical protein
MPTIIRQEGFPYAFNADACATCGGRCCTGESGNIFVKADEIRAIAKSLDMEVEAFIAQYLEKRGYKYSIKERIVGLSHDCIFFNREIGGCDIYMARPLQCRTFPFWDYFRNRVEELKRECPGIIDD